MFGRWYGWVFSDSDLFSSFLKIRIYKKKQNGLGEILAVGTCRILPPPNSGSAHGPCTWELSGQKQIKGHPITKQHLLLYQSFSVSKKLFGNQDGNPDSECCSFCPEGMLQPGFCGSSFLACHLCGGWVLSRFFLNNCSCFDGLRCWSGWAFSNTNSSLVYITIQHLKKNRSVWDKSCLQEMYPVMQCRCTTVSCW